MVFANRVFTLLVAVIFAFVTKLFVLKIRLIGNKMTTVTGILAVAHQTVTVSKIDELQNA